MYYAEAFVQKVVTVEKSMMKVEPFGAITRLDRVFFKDLNDAKLTFEEKLWKCLGFKIQMYFSYWAGASLQKVSTHHINLRKTILKKKKITIFCQRIKS